nr:ATP-binding cassette domain-containing protein [Geminicoccus flavidas]
MSTATAVMPLWQIDGVSFEVPGRQILQPLTLSLARGQVHGLIGPNGSGKSTLVKLLARQLQPAGGTIRFDGRRLAEFGDRAFARQVAYLPQFTPAADGMTVRELVRLGRFPWHGTLRRFSAGDEAAVESALTRTGVMGLAGRAVDSLSGGERQRAWVALMLAQSPRCLLLDEPTSALDIAHQIELLSLVQELAHAEAGLTVIVVLHDINMAVRTCDRLIALKSGQLIAEGPPAAIMRPEVLRAIYGLDMGILPHPTRGEPLGYVL